MEKEKTFRIFTFSLLIGGAAGATAFAGASAHDVAAGEKTFNVCRACHEIGDGAKNLVGPVLNGVVGRKSGSHPGYVYSYANKNSGITWDEPTLTEYLKNPRAVVRGTKMLFPWGRISTTISERPISGFLTSLLARLSLWPDLPVRLPIWRRFPCATKPRHQGKYA
jgi:cytochrome c